MHFSLSRTEFRAIYNNSKRKTVGDILFLYSKYDSPKLGLTVSKKYGNAVKRNLFKRRVREVFINKVYKTQINVALIVKPKKPDINYTSIDCSFDKLMTLI